MEDIIVQYLNNFPLSKKRPEFALPPGPRENYIRHDGTVKGQGWLGPLPTSEDNSVATELGIGVDGIEIPSIVPGLSDEQLNHLLTGGRPSRDMIDIAFKHAKKQIDAGNSVWAK